MIIKQARGARAAVVLAAAALGIAACGGGPAGAPGGASGLSGPVVIDGSSTVEPLSSAAAELFQAEQPGVNVTVGTSGTGGGFQKFCAGETDISDASRPIKDKEKAKCAENGITSEQLLVANDALTVVVNKENTWANCLTTAQLKKIWEDGSTVKTWNEVDPSFPAEPLTLFGPGADSGTFDYFTEAINGEAGNSRKDYSPTEDDNVTVQGVSGSKGALGYFGFSYYEENADTLKAVQIDGGNGCVAPSAAAAQDGSYQPLARPLFIYVSDASLKKPQVVAFVEFYLKNSDQIAKAARFIPLTDAQKQKTADALAALKAKAGV
ncbi:MAG: PstS family phosphate ABC transporter substrate-binding protein [Pseudonocardia sp.]|nr:PstS family phosphate ABC transporter substrate-binding protein [Pseudonocardia sp.]